jgi:hypothetical protein
VYLQAALSLHRLVSLPRLLLSLGSCSRALTTPRSWRTRRRAAYDAGRLVKRRPCGRFAFILSALCWWVKRDGFREITTKRRPPSAQTSDSCPLPRRPASRSPECSRGQKLMKREHIEDVLSMILRFARAGLAPNCAGGGRRLRGDRLPESRRGGRRRDGAPVFGPRRFTVDHGTRRSAQISWPLSRLAARFCRQRDRPIIEISLDGAQPLKKASRIIVGA